MSERESPSARESSLILLTAPPPESSSLARAAEPAFGDGKSPRRPKRSSTPSTSRSGDKLSGPGDNSSAIACSNVSVSSSTWPVSASCASVNVIAPPERTRAPSARADHGIFEPVEDLVLDEHERGEALGDDTRGGTTRGSRGGPSTRAVGSAGGGLVTYLVTRARVHCTSKRNYTITHLAK